MKFNTSKALFILADIYLFFMAFFGAYHFRVESLEIQDLLTPQSVFSTFLVLTFYYIFGAYSYIRPRFTYKDVLQLFIASLLAGIFMSSFIYISQTPGSGLLGRGVVAGAFLLFWVVSSLYRWLFLNVIGRSLQQKHYLVIFEKSYYELFTKDLEKAGQGERYSFVIPGAKADPSQKILGGLEALKTIVKDKRRRWTGIVVGLHSTNMEQVEDTVMKARISGLPVYSLSDYYEEAWEKVPVYTLSRTWFVFTGGFRLLKSSFRFRIKRLMDIFLSSTLLVLSFPLQVLVFFMVRLTSRGPVFFRQSRTGEQGKPFSIIKFRTMKLDAEKSGPTWTVPGDKRITWMGQCLRRMRLDELPQLVNVIRGEMSFIGPRPERPEFDGQLIEQIPFYDLRYQVKPGITGWAQVRYPYGASVEDTKEKLQYDLYYIKNYSFFLDMMILLKTVRVVLGWKGR